MQNHPFMESSRMKREMKNFRWDLRDGVRLIAQQTAYSAYPPGY